MPDVTAERQRHSRGYVTFQYIWLLYKPGSSVIVNMDFKSIQHFAPYHQGYVVESVERKIDAFEQMMDNFEVRLWGLAFDGSSVGRVSYTHLIQAFKGEIEIKSLDIVPVDWISGTAADGSVAQRLAVGGRKAFNLLTPRCLQHTGKSKSFPFDDIDGLVMIDTKRYYTDNFEERPGLLPSPPQSRKTGVVECYCPVCKERNEKSLREPVSNVPEDGFAEYYDISVHTTELTEHQYFLFPSRLHAFHFRSREWEQVDVSDLGPPRFHDTILDTLVMKPDRINMIKALSKKYMRPMDGSEHKNAEFWSADFIAGKGKSQILLLHGKPGVGKTYTAECIAEHTKRPLLTLTCADIGTDPEKVEENLTYHFTTAKQWGALVLIDEADIYMERRSVSDLTRNSLVASFLRALETFEGMLFLTTNRVGAFDDAFVSRIHVKLYYPALEDDDRQKIWQAFMHKLAQERRKDIRVTIGAKEYINGAAVKALKLNGREIRNAFQTAVALAEYEQIRDEEGALRIEEQHVQQVAEMTREFQTYLNDLHHGDEDKRAKRNFERHDG